MPPILQAPAPVPVAAPVVPAATRAAAKETSIPSEKPASTSPATTRGPAKLGTPKTSVLSVRVPPELREAIEKAAVAAGMTVSGFIARTMQEALSGRKQARAAVNTPVNKDAGTTAGVVLTDPAVVYELRRIGNNINQIAHAVNAELPPDVQLTIEQFRHLFEALADEPQFRSRLDEIRKDPPA